MTTSSGVSGADGSYSSPPYFMQELDSNFSGSVVDPVQTRDVTRLRKAVHQRLIAAHLALEIGELEVNSSLQPHEIRMDRIVTGIAPSARYAMTLDDMEASIGGEQFARR